MLETGRAMIRSVASLGVLLLWLGHPIHAQRESRHPAPVASHVTWVAALEEAVCAEQDGEPSLDRLKRLIRQLGDDDVEVRGRSSRELSRAGAPALPLLNEAVQGDNPEIRCRAAELVRKISVELYLKRADNRELRTRWEEIKSGTFVQRRQAIKAWVRTGGASPDRVDALLGLFALDPGGDAGSVSGEALNWLCAPRLMSEVERMGHSGWSEPRPVFQELDYWTRWIPWHVSAAVRAKMEAGVLPPCGWDDDYTALDKLRLVGEICEVAFRLDDDRRRLHWETPAESLASWIEWWKAVKPDRFRLVDLGLLPRPDAGRLSGVELEEWVGALSSRAPGHARAARAVLKEMPGGWIPEIGKRAAVAGAPAELRGMHDRLLLRSRGRILFSSQQEDERRLYVMNLDGSGSRKISGDLKEAWSADPCNDFRFAYGTARSPDGKAGVYRFDLAGAELPVRVSDLAGTVWASPDGKKVAIRTYEETNVLHVVDSATGKDTVFGDDGQDVWQVAWSPDSKTLAWSVSWNRTLYLLSSPSAKPVAIPDCNAQQGRFSFSPDSRSIAFCREDFDKSAPVDAWSHQIEVIDVSTRKRRTISGPFWSLSEPQWSPDGTRIAYEGHARNQTATVHVFDVLREKVEIRVTPLRLDGGSSGWCRFTPEGTTVVYYHQPPRRERNGDFSGEAAVFIDVAKGVVQSINRRISCRAEFLPGLDWVLDSDMHGDLVLWKKDDSGLITLTESTGDPSSPRFLPPPTK